MAEAVELQKEMMDFKESFKSEIQAVLARAPLLIQPRKVKVDLDADTPGTEHLPPPLLPLVVNGDLSSVGVCGSVMDTSSSTSTNEQLDVNSSTSSTESRHLVSAASDMVMSSGSQENGISGSAPGGPPTYHVEIVEPSERNGLTGSDWTVTNDITNHDSTNNNRVLSDSDNSSGDFPIVIGNSDNCSLVAE
jgi:hypothetical protein